MYPPFSLSLSLSLHLSPHSTLSIFSHCMFPWWLKSTQFVIDLSGLIKTNCSGTVFHLHIITLVVQKILGQGHRHRDLPQAALTGSQQGSPILKLLPCDVLPNFRTEQISKMGKHKSMVPLKVVSETVTKYTFEWEVITRELLLGTSDYNMPRNMSSSQVVIYISVHWGPLRQDNQMITFITC